MVGAYACLAAFYLGWRFGQGALRRDQEMARLRSEIWELQAAQRRAAEAPVSKETAA